MSGIKENQERIFFSNKWRLNNDEHNQAIGVACEMVLAGSRFFGCKKKTKQNLFHHFRQTGTVRDCPPKQEALRNHSTAGPIRHVDASGPSVSPGYCDGQVLWHNSSDCSKPV